MTAATKEGERTKDAAAVERSNGGTYTYETLDEIPVIIFGGQAARLQPPEVAPRRQNTAHMGGSSFLRKLFPVYTFSTYHTADGTTQPQNKKYEVKNKKNLVGQKMGSDPGQGGKKTESAHPM